MAQGPAYDSAPPAPPGARTVPADGARAALVLLLSINLFNYVDRSILYALADTIETEFKVSKAAIGLLNTAFLITYMVLSPVFGLLADRFSRWALIGVGVVLWSLASGGSGLAGAYAVMLAMRCLVGVGEAAYGPVAPTLISDFYPVRVRGKVLSWFYVAFPVGTAIGYSLGGQFAHPGKWHHAFLLTIPPGIILGAWCFFMREPNRGAAERGAAERDGPATAADPPAAVVPQRKVAAADYKVLAKIPSYVLNTAAMSALTFAIGGVGFWMPAYLTRDRGLSSEQATFVFGLVLVVAGLVATLAGGFIGDWLRDRFPGSYFLVSAAGALVGFPLVLLMLVTPLPWAWGVIFLAIFCLFFNTGPSNTALANVTPPAIRATAFAVNILVIHTLGDAISPAVVGFVADRFKRPDRSGLSVGFVVVSAMMALAGVLWLFASRHLARDTDLAPRRLDDNRPGFPVVPLPPAP